MATRPDWIDSRFFPFDSRWLEVSGGRMHYLDEGTGPPLLFLHGNPTWSFMYRKAIKNLSDQHRCIALDHVGFGLSEKPADWGYRPWQHAENVLNLIDHLGLESFHLVVHDWGGPIGMAVAREVPDRLDGLVVFNSWMWPLNDSLRARLFSRSLGSRLGRYLVKTWGLFERWIMPFGVHHRNEFYGDVHDHYLRPFEDPGSRQGIWQFPVDLLQAGDWLEELWSNRDFLRDVPALLLWGRRDPAFGDGDRDRWTQAVGPAEVQSFEDASHYVMEDRGDEATDQIRRFL